MKRTICLVLVMAAGIGAGPATRPGGLAGESRQVESVARGELLRPRDASSKEGERIVVYPRQDWKCMTWKMEGVGGAGDEVRLINYFTHKTLYPEGAEDGAAVTQHRAAKDVADVERWRFVEVGDGLYRIEHVGSGRVLSVTDEGEVVAGKWTEAKGQKWKLLGKPERFTG